MAEPTKKHIEFARRLEIPEGIIHSLDEKELSGLIKDALLAKKRIEWIENKQRPALMRLETIRQKGIEVGISRVTRDGKMGTVTKIFHTGDLFGQTEYKVMVKWESYRFPVIQDPRWLKVVI